jgi:4-phosphopantoate--beta-alanine ligase
MGKKVIAIDLNPLSRTARMAHITIVDELTRCLPLLSDFVKENKGIESFDNGQCLSDVLNYISERLRS